MRFPEWYEAPERLLAIDGHCGLVAAWAVLRYFGKRAPVASLARLCGHTKRHGVFTIGLASGLKRLGLQVSFHSLPDAAVGAYEKRLYARARRLGIRVEPARSLAFLLQEQRRGRVPIVFYNTPSNLGHFSPLLGARGSRLRLPLASGGEMTRHEFHSSWNEPQILRQAVIVSR